MPGDPDHVLRILRAHIATGEYAEGDALPSPSELMEQWKLSMIAAARIPRDLRAAGLAMPGPGGKGSVVAPGARPIARRLAGLPAAEET